MDTDNIIHIAADAGKLMLENGGETYRVEQTISTICKTFEIHNVNSFITPTTIVISINNNGETVSTVRRLTGTTVNLKKVSLVADLSERISNKSIPTSEIERELRYISTLPPYRDDTVLISSMFAAGFFALLFGGAFRDFFISFFIGMLITLSGRIFKKYNVNSFFTNVCGGFIASSIAVIAHHFNPNFNIDKIIIGAIMLLVPGLLVTNAIRDTLNGDLISGISRAVEALIIAVSIAIGTAIGFKLFIFILGGTL
ncbi:threonine/serine exporter family protein [Clostridium senegalense]|uniref:threonine/serine exporter family protein n=1 Tax=Clostridium senegalense TaxID=1465809 RepID=UPI000289A171|nr:threonine/serine exporter family protein [Clostridium senegalense]MBU5225677.1 threonine/serine exporter family protein [Clostridium senegalense]